MRKGGNDSGVFFLVRLDEKGGGAFLLCMFYRKRNEKEKQGGLARFVDFDCESLRLRNEVGAGKKRKNLAKVCCLI